MELATCECKTVASASLKVGSRSKLTPSLAGGSACAALTSECVDSKGTANLKMSVFSFDVGLRRCFAFRSLSL